jgi:nitroimidazol reductase NimA-like FMN-containing flavoprotein (pyridoxamine 5'-phosphate oxidase superfamily)
LAPQLGEFAQGSRRPRRTGSQKGQTMPKLTDQEMMDFLAERSHLARIATVRADGSPSVVPVWFIFEGGKVLITPRKHSAFLQNLQGEPRVAITIDEEAGRYRKVLFEGKAEILI